MRDLYVGENGDFEVVGKTLKIASEKEADRTLIIYRLKTYLGGCTIDTSIGGPRNVRGSTVNEINLTEIRQQVEKSIRRGGQLSFAPMEIDVVPISLNDLAVIISVLKIYPDEEPLVVSFLYNPELGEFELPTGGS